MNRINETAWKEFSVADIFHIRNTKSIPQQDIEPDSGRTPYVTAKDGDNGVLTYITCPDEWLEQGNCLMVGGKTMTFSYQSRPFCSNDSHNIALYQKAQGTTFSESHWLFLLTALRSSLARRYTWSDSISMRRLKNEAFWLPCNAEGEPNWAYMDSYMKLVMNEANEAMLHLLDANGAGRLPDGKSWNAFAIKDLFVVRKGTRLTRADMLPGDTPFIGATLENNGITATVGNKGHVHPGGVMTVAYNGQKATGKAFWQPEPFWASDDVNVLYPKFELTKEIALFLQPLFWEAGRPYSFGDKWGKEIMEQTTIRLPICESGEPDWQWMGDYMKTMLREAESSISQLQTVTPITQLDC